jgi:hypothetical protein
LHATLTQRASPTTQVNIEYVDEKGMFSGSKSGDKHGFLSIGRDENHRLSIQAQLKRVRLAMFSISPSLRTNY